MRYSGWADLENALHVGGRCIADGSSQGVRAGGNGGVSRQEAVQQADAVQVGVALLQAGKQGPDGTACCQHKLHHLPPAPTMPQ